MNELEIKLAVLDALEKVYEAASESRGRPIDPNVSKCLSSIKDDLWMLSSLREEG